MTKQDVLHDRKALWLHTFMTQGTPGHVFSFLKMQPRLLKASKTHMHARSGHAYVIVTAKVFSMQSSDPRWKETCCRTEARSQLAKFVCQCMGVLTQAWTTAPSVTHTHMCNAMTVVTPGVTIAGSGHVRQNAENADCDQVIKKEAYGNVRDLSRHHRHGEAIPVQQGRGSNPALHNHMTVSCAFGPAIHTGIKTAQLSQYSSNLCIYLHQFTLVAV
jgi:hypothetical protein